MEYKFNSIPDICNLKTLYSACDWSAYLKDEERFINAIES